jgi:hypothetical protein
MKLSSATGYGKVTSIPTRSSDAYSGVVNGELRLRDVSVVVETPD